MTWGLDEHLRETIINLRKYGWTYGGIASHLKLTKGQVAGVLWRAGLCKKKEVKRDKSDYSRVA